MIDNRGGGGGVPAAVAFKQAPPDGYTLFLANNGVFAIMPALTPNIQFDPVKDFAPVTPLFAFPSVLVVPAGSPAKSAKELVALAKTKAGGLNFGSQGVGSGGHILGEMFRLVSGAPMTHVPYRGAGPAVNDLVAGNIDFLFSSYVSAIGQVEAGKLRVLGWTATKRSPALPNVPTMAEAGFAGTELEIWQGIVGAARHAGRDRAQAQRRIRQGRAVPRGRQQGGGAGGRDHHLESGGVRQADRVRRRTASAR